MNARVIDEPTKHEHADSDAVANASTQFEIDPFRGIICLNIVLVHITCFGSVGTRLIDALGVTQAATALNWRFGYESFYVLAGYFTVHSFRTAEGNYLSVPRYLWRRWLRLVLPYWCALTLAIVDIAAPNWILGHHNPTPSWGSILAHATFSQDIFGYPSICVVFWSIASLVQYQLLWAATFWSLRRLLGKPTPNSLREWMYAITFFVLVVSLTSFAATPTLQWRLPHIVCFFSLGSITYWYTRKKLPHHARFLLPIAIFVLFAIETNNSRFIAAVVTAIVLHLLVAHSLTLPRITLVRALEWIGVRSYSVYLVHALIAYRLLNYFASRNLMSSAGEKATVFFITLAAVFLGSALFHRFIEVPAVRLSRDVTYRK